MLFLLPLLFACSPDAALAPPVDSALLASYAVGANLWIDAPDVAVEGEPLTFRAVLENSGGARTVRVFVSDALGQGPCDPRSGVCLDLIGQRTLIDQRTLRHGTWSVTWTPPAPAGTRLWLQAALFENGVLRQVDDPQLVDVVPRVLGCTFAGSPDFDPQATLDDGSCQCHREGHVHAQADFAAIQACSGLDRLTIDGPINGVISLPDLQWVGAMEVTGATGVTGVDLSALREGALTFDGVEGSFDLVLPSSQGAVVTVNASPGLRALRVPAAASVAQLELTWNPNLTTVDLEGPAELGWAEIGWNDALTSVHAASALVWALEVFGNAALDAVTLTGARGAARVSVYSNPALREVEVDGARLGQLLVYENASITRISAPNATSARVVDGSYNPALTSFDLPRLGTVLDLAVIGSGMPALAFPALTDARDLTFYGDPALASVSLPALVSGSIEVSQNPLFCVTADPWWASPPPGVRVTGTANLCDP